VAEGEATGGAGRLEIRDRGSLEAWLGTQPREVAVIIAARAALRVLPLYERVAPSHPDEQQFATSVALLFAASAIARVTAKYPSWIMEFRPAAAFIAPRVTEARARSNADYSARNAADAAAGAAFAAQAFIAGDAAARAYAADATAASAQAPPISDAVIWAEVSADANSLSTSRVDAARLAEKALWQERRVFRTGRDRLGTSGMLEREPGWASSSWRDLVAALPKDEDWDVWIEWYDARLAGDPADQETELIYATVPLEKWDEGAAAANAWIREQLDRIERSIFSAAFEEGWDFFLSYSTHDETFARFVDDVLRQAGHRVFAQFRDMPAGSNFVVEMNKGLRDSDRFIALLSPHYVASKHCKAEWSAVFADDPSGEQRKLVPLLIAPADLPALLRQVVSAPLVGLERREAAQAILTAIGAVGTNLLHLKEPWPIAETYDAMARKTRGVFPTRLEGDRLTVDAVAPNDSLAERYGFSAPELYADMRHAFLAYAEELEATTGNFHYPEPMRRSAQGLLRAAPEDMGACRPLPMNRALKMALQALDRAERAGELPEHDMAHYHRAELRGLYERLAAIYTELLDYRDMDRNERMRPPSPEERRFLDELLRETAADDKVATPELQDELRGSSEALAEAERNLPPGASEAARKQELREPLKAATAQAIPLWAWLSDARRKFEKAGKSAKEAEDAIANFTKLAQRISGAAAFFKWLSEWWF